MYKSTIEKYIGKKVKIQMKNNNVYTLTIKDVTGSDFSAIDKFGNELSMSNDDVLVIEKTKNGGDVR